MEIGMQLCPGPDEFRNVLPLAHFESKRAATLTPMPLAFDRICSPTFSFPLSFIPTNGQRPLPAPQITGPLPPTNPTTTGPFAGSRFTTAQASHDLARASCPCFHPAPSPMIESSRPVPVTSKAATELPFPAS